MNKLQYEQLELLKIFVKICEKYDLKYYMVCGSALGAVKYSGFIPWDDDIDVALPRPDYDKFCDIASVVLPENIFLQNFRTDPEFPHIFSKLRNSNTTFIEKGTAHLKINHGVYIDVFPLDGHPVDCKQQRIFEFRKKILTWKQYCSLKDKSKMKIRVRNCFFRILGYHKRTQKTLFKLEKLYKSYDLQSSAAWCNYGNYQGKLEYAPKAQYGEGIKVNFEGIQVNIPEKYDEYLTQKFGNWRADLPIEQQYGHHFYLIFDPMKSYMEYIETENFK